MSVRIYLQDSLDVILYAFQGSAAGSIIRIDQRPFSKRSVEAEVAADDIIPQPFQ